MPLHYKVRNEYLQKRQYGSQTENIYNLVLYLKNVLISDVSPVMSFFFFSLLACCQYLPWLSSTAWILPKKTIQANKLPDQSYIRKEGKLMPGYEGEKVDARLWRTNCMLVISHSAVFTLCDPRDCCLLGSSVCGTSQQVYWSGWPFPPYRDLPVPGTEPTSPASPALTRRLSHLRIKNQRIS